MILTGVGLFALNEGFGFFGSNRTYLDEEAILHGSIIGGIGLLLLGRGLGNMTQKPLLFFPLIIGIALVGFAWVERSEIVDDYRETQDNREEIFDDFLEVCEDGTGIDDAERFEPGGNDHPTLAYFGRGTADNIEWSPDWNQTPEDWEVEDADDVELVACIRVESQTIHRCAYNSTGSSASTLSLVQYVQTLHLREAQTGEILLTEQWVGSDPPPCPNTYDFSSGSSLSGSLMSSEQIYERVTQFMEAGATESEEPDKPSTNTTTKTGK